MSAKFKGVKSSAQRVATVGNVSKSLLTVLEAMKTELDKRDARIGDMELAIAVKLRDLTNRVETLEMPKKHWILEKLHGTG